MSVGNGIWDGVVVTVLGVTTWAAGEAGRIWISGAAGGLMRWVILSGWRLRDGLVQVLIGALCARYLSPVALALIEKAVGQLRDGTDVQSTAAFIAGLGGMSMAKIILAALDSRSGKFNGGGGDAT